VTWWARQNKDFLITKGHGGLDKIKIFSSQSDMVGWTKQRFSHHKVTWMVG
jgi:hypothetical protein